MKFDTRNKKPKLYHIAAISLIVALFLLLLMITDADGNAHLINGILNLYYLLVIVLLVRSLIGQLEYNPYSYNTIYYIGFAIFVFSLLITHFATTIRFMKQPALLMAEHSINTLSNSANTYILFSLPFVLVFSIALCISNAVLIRKEGLYFGNVLGILLSIGLLTGYFFLWKFNYYVSGSQREVMFHDLWMSVFSTGFLYFECMLTGTIAADLIAAKHVPDRDKDFMIIPGCAIRKDGTPTPILQGRIDTALDFYRRQKEESGKELIFITSGGQGADEVISESRSMKNYLLSKGIREEQIIEEDRSTSTYENMKFSREKIMERDPAGKIAFSTTNFHVFRAGLWARRVKMRAIGIGAPTKWYFWPNAAVREFAGLLSQHRMKQTLILGGMFFVYVVLILIEYR